MRINMKNDPSWYSNTPKEYIDERVIKFDDLKVEVVEFVVSCGIIFTWGTLAKKFDSTNQFVLALAVRELENEGTIQFMETGQILKGPIAREYFG
jgi:hypothetical protein